MRKIADVTGGLSIIKRIMTFETDNGVYLFQYTSLEDSSAASDQWFESVAAMDEECQSEFGIGPDDWKVIDDPLEGCQHDWIAPVRVMGRNTGMPQWGSLERLENGEWKEIIT